MPVEIMEMVVRAQVKEQAAEAANTTEKQIKNKKPYCQPEDIYDRVAELVREKKER